MIPSLWITCLLAHLLGVHPFIPKLKRFINKNKPKIITKNGTKKIKKSNSSVDVDVDRHNERFDDRNNVTFDDYKKSKKSWGVEEMFAANAKITGMKRNGFLNYKMIYLLAI